MDDGAVSTLASRASSWTRDSGDGVYETRTVEACLDYLLDGISVRDLIRQWNGDTPESHLTVFDLTDGNRAVRVMSGMEPFDDWVEDLTRVPVLLCWCGDLLCGAVTVRLTMDAGSISWSDWAWENFHGEPERLTAAPGFTFSAESYLAALSQGCGLARELAGTVETEVRVRTPVIRWRHRGSGHRHRQHRMLERLHARPIRPALVDATGSYGDFLMDLDSAQAMVTGLCSANAQDRRSSDLEEAVALLRSLKASPHLRRLPRPTQRAIAWFEEDLASN